MFKIFVSSNYDQNQDFKANNWVYLKEELQTDEPVSSDVNYRRFALIKNTFSSNFATFFWYVCDFILTFVFHFKKKAPLKSGPYIIVVSFPWYCDKKPKT